MPTSKPSGTAYERAANKDFASDGYGEERTPQALPHPKRQKMAVYAATMDQMTGVMDYDAVKSID